MKDNPTIAKRTIRGIIIALLAMGTIDDCAARGRQEKGYTFKMVSREWGAETVHVADDFICLDMHGMGVRFVSEAPSWNLTAYSPSKKAICYLGPPEAPGPFHLQRITSRLPVERKASLQGLSVLWIALRYRRNRSGEDGWMNLFTEPNASEKHNRGRSSRPRVIEWHCAITDKIKVSQDVIDAMSRTLGVPSMGGLPLEAYDVQPDGSKQSDWALKSWHPAQLDASMAAVPKGYKPMRTIDQLFGNQVSKDMDELLEGFDVGRPFGSEKKAPGK